MNKTFIKITLLLMVGILATSCAKSKLKDAVSYLNKIPTFVANENVNQTMEFSNDLITIDIPPIQNQNELRTMEGGEVSDQMIIDAVICNMFGSNISALLIGDALGTKKGGDPIGEFFDLTEKENVNFLVKYKDKEIKLTPAEVKKILKR